jgi:hypothetical protein
MCKIALYKVHANDAYMSLSCLYMRKNRIVRLMVLMSLRMSVCSLAACLLAVLAARRFDFGTEFNELKARNLY